MGHNKLKFSMLLLLAKPLFAAVQLHVACNIPNSRAVSLNFHFTLE
jgi:hypothetical protein